MYVPRYVLNGWILTSAVLVLHVHEGHVVICEISDAVARLHMGPSSSVALLLVD